jgi:hypothetical protein
MEARSGLFGLLLLLPPLVGREGRPCGAQRQMTRRSVLPGLLLPSSRRFVEESRMSRNGRAMIWVRSAAGNLPTESAP